METLQWIKSDKINFPRNSFKKMIHQIALKFNSFLLYDNFEAPLVIKIDKIEKD